MVFAVVLVAIFLLHAPLLGLPYFWDEAGYYVPAARDLLLTGSVIPHSTPSNAHPPLVMAYLAGGWKVMGFSIFVTRSLMLLVAAFSLLGCFDWHGERPISRWRLRQRFAQPFIPCFLRRARWRMWIWLLPDSPYGGWKRTSASAGRGPWCGSRWRCLPKKRLCWHR